MTVEGLKILYQEASRVVNEKYHTNLPADVKFVTQTGRFLMAYDFEDEYFVANPNTLKYYDQHKIETFLAHEMCHMLSCHFGTEDGEKLPLFWTEQFDQLIIMADNAHQTNLINLIRKLERDLVRLAENWAVPRIVDELIGKGENSEIVKIVNSILVYRNSVPGLREFWEENKDLFFDSLEFYEVGGHDELWEYWKEELEDTFNIKIPVVNSVR